MLKIGLTGGIGCGKSSVVHFFQQYDVPFIDADHIAKELVQPGQPALDEIASELGHCYIQKDGSLDRGLLKEKVFNNSLLLNQLESILHPRIREAITQGMDAIIARSKNESHHYLIVDVPLLVEKKYQDLFDEIIVVDCTEKQQLQRTLIRDQLDVEMVKRIISQQASRKERLEIATETLDNSGSIERLALQVEALHYKFSH